MRKYSLYITGLFILLVACEEIYYPEMNEVTTLPVIEARLTNFSNHTVRLTRSVSFTKNKKAENITNAIVKLIEEGAGTYDFINYGSGNYRINKKLEPGKKYKLSVSFNNATFESSWEKLPPVPEIKKIYVEPRDIEKYVLNSDGQLVNETVHGFQISADIPVNDENSYYMFQWYSILQLYIPPLPPRGDEYGWLVFPQIQLGNLAERTKYSNITEIKKHPLAFHNRDHFAYFDSTPQKSLTDPPPEAEYPPRTQCAGWIFYIIQYGITESTMEMYKKITSLINADNQLFDPIYTQIVGNMKCIDNPNAIMLGHFELSSVAIYEYYVTNVVSDPIYYHQINPLINIPSQNGHDLGNPPWFWQTQRK